MFVDNSRYKDLIEWFGQGTSEEYWPSCGEMYFYW
jgi:hypothetical protein